MSDLYFFSHEAMTDLVAVMSTLVNDEGRILIDGMYNDVAPLITRRRKTCTNVLRFDTVR